MPESWDTKYFPLPEELSFLRQHVINNQGPGHGGLRHSLLGVTAAVAFFRWFSADSFLQIGSVHMGLRWAGTRVLPEGSRIRLSALLEILLLPELC